MTKLSLVEIRFFISNIIYVEDDLYLFRSTFHQFAASPKGLDEEGGVYVEEVGEQAFLRKKTTDLQNPLISMELPQSADLGYFWLPDKKYIIFSLSGKVIILDSDTLRYGVLKDVSTFDFGWYEEETDKRLWKQLWMNEYAL